MAAMIESFRAQNVSDNSRIVSALDRPGNPAGYLV